MRYYSSTASVMALSAPVNELATTIAVDTVLGLPAQTPFTLVLDVGLSTEEIVTVTGVAGTSLTVTRGEDNSTAIAHTIGAVTRHMMTARDLREPAVHVAAAANVHGIGATASVVGTDTAQALTNKTINFADNTALGVPQASVTGLVDDIAALVLADVNLALADAGLVGDIADTKARVTTLESPAVWTAYTPTLGSIGGTAPTLGAGGFVNGNHRSDGVTCEFLARIVFGNSPSPGVGGAYILSVPFILSPVYPEIPFIAQYKINSSAVAHRMTAELQSDTSYLVFRDSATINAWGPTWPAAPAAGDVLIVRGSYPI